MEAALKATDFEGLDLLPADFTYRNMDLDLDDTKQPHAAGCASCCRQLADDYDTVVPRLPAQRVAGVGERAATPPTPCWSR